MAKKNSNPHQGIFHALDSAQSMSIESYSGDKPNPCLRQFVELHRIPYAPDADDYEVAAFTQPITTSKATAIYNMHSYHQGKKPHDAIRQYVRHYTKAGDIVMDPFCGSGGTALAALLDDRKAVTIDRSPAATFIAKSYCTPLGVSDFRQTVQKFLAAVTPEIEDLYDTRCDRCGGKASIGFTVYSQTVQCPRCLNHTSLYDCAEAEGVTQAGKPKKLLMCPLCLTKGHKEEITSRTERCGAVPVVTSYICQSGCRPARGERHHADDNRKKREFFEKYDLAQINRIAHEEIPYWYPRSKMMNVEDDSLPWGAEWRPSRNFRFISDLFTKRNLRAIATLWDHAGRITNRTHADFVRLAITGTMFHLSKMSHHKQGGGGITVGTFLLPPLCKERNALANVSAKIDEIIAAMQAGIADVKPYVCLSTQSSCDLSAIPPNSIDYIFTDPPYSDMVQYGELNFVWESWLGFDTHWHDQEIIVNDVRGKTAGDWAASMKRAMAECYRVLKPGRWLTLCFHDEEGTWALVQDFMAEVGFVVDKSDAAIFIDAGQKSFNQLTADKARLRDLVLNFRKPRPGEWCIRSYEPGSFQDAARSVIRDFLNAHPGATKDRVYDAVVSTLVQMGKMEAHDFDSLLKSVAEEVQQPVKKDLFRNREPELWGSHVQSRWYLKETADQVDHAEQAKEDAAAKRLETFIGEHLKKTPELEGVHYSDLFEQYLPVHDKPRRLLADWMPEYFIKTPSGTWRVPDKEESLSLGKLREAGTLRRIKRFANALMEGVPIRERDRSGSDVDLLDWLRQCRRAGLYEQGKAIYERGGLNLASLSDEQQIEAEDDYRICVRRGSEVENKPTLTNRRKKGDDE
jgi:16S rRNA G966 N2-methylase RsmD